VIAAGAAVLGWYLLPVVVVVLLMVLAYLTGIGVGRRRGRLEQARYAVARVVDRVRAEGTRAGRLVGETTTVVILPQQRDGQQ
jgi:hypothetical protein